MIQAQSPIGERQTSVPVEIWRSLILSHVSCRQRLVQILSDLYIDIDVDISQADRDAANKLINREIVSGYQKTAHPSLQPLSPPKFSDLMSQEISRMGEGGPRKGGIDTSRYEAPDDPSDNADIATWKTALQNAYTSSTYLSGRRINLSLLEEYGKNAWLIGNYELEGILKMLEAELAEFKLQNEEVNKARKIAQESSRGEFQALEDTWKKGIGKIIEVQVATEQLRAELSQRRRDAAA